jgi:hypothetical protein
MKTEIQKANSAYQKEINRLHDFCNMYRESNDARKKQIAQFHDFLDFLLTEKRITKDEIKRFIKNKKQNKNEEG